MQTKALIFLFLTGITTQAIFAEDAVKQLFDSYALEGATQPDAEAGRQLWMQSFPSKGKSDGRSCTSCHGTDLKQTGKHVRTHKAIEPMAPSVNPERLIKTSEVEKWFKRNCKWTLGRECTVTEKANLLAFIRKN